MNTTPIATDPALTVSDAARARIRELIAERGDRALKLRVSVEGGGCSGFQYDIRLADDRAADDLVLERDGVALLVDPLSAGYLGGAEIDYVEKLSGAKFVIRNPNATSTCGCGSSFAA